MDYFVPEAGIKALEDYSLSILKDPGEFVHPDLTREIGEGLDVSAVGRSLPEGMGIEDFRDALMLGYRTEAATETYDHQFQMVADLFGVGWLGRFNAEVWSPDEKTHNLPYFDSLVDLGYYPSDLIRIAREDLAREFEHRGVLTPIGVTWFGTIQERVTDGYHGVVAKTVRASSPVAADRIVRVRKRETLHTVWYNRFTAIQVQYNPELLEQVAIATAKFEMPEHQVAPDLAHRGGELGQMMGADYRAWVRDLVRYMHELTNDVNKTGRLMLDLAAARGDSLAGMNPKILRSVLTFLRQNGFVGEIVLESFGFDQRIPQSNGLVNRIKSLLRHQIVRHVNVAGVYS